MDITSAQVESIVRKIVSEMACGSLGSYSVTLALVSLGVGFIGYLLHGKRE